MEPINLGPLAVAFAPLGPGIGIGLLAAAYCNSVARQPEVQGKLFLHVFAIIGLIELLGLFGFLTFIMSRG